MKKTLLTYLSILCFVITAVSQTTFAALQNIDPNTGTDPTYVVSGDLDGDTDIDIAIGTYYYADGQTQDYIKWYQNDGSGNFTLQTSVSESILWVQGLTIADVDALNSNGNDIIATAAVGNKLVYYPNDGAGGFGSEVIISSTINGPGQVVSGDINKDGNLDIATVSYTDNETIWFAGDGIGGFIEQASSPIQSGGTGGPFYIDIADFDGDTNIDGDTDLDILVGFYNTGAIEIYYNQYVESGGNNGGGSVSWIKDAVTVDSGISFLAVATNQIAFADVNNDDVLDVVKCDNGTGEVEWFSKIKNGTSTPNPISNSTIIDRPATVVVTDLDNDGNNDVIVSDGGSANHPLIWFKGNDNASPETTESLIGADNNFQMFGITVDDFDSDSDIDIATVGRFSSTVDWYENEWDLLGIEDNSLNNIRIYPNPTTNKLYFKSSIAEDFNISVYDILGKKVLENTVNINKSLDVSQLNNGIYIVRFDDYNSTYKFVKE